MKLSIGTAAFGMDYGVFNKTPKLDKDVIDSILTFAKKYNIDLLDTAQLYGDSERIIGSANSSSFHVITKITPGIKSELVEAHIDLSMKNLKRNYLDGVLLHEFNDYISDNNNYVILNNLKRDGKIKKIGFSLYYTNHLEYLLENNVDFDIVQIPYNVFDQRFSSFFPILRRRKIEIHVRSVFLQGVVFLEMNKLPYYFKKYKKQFLTLNKISTKYNIPISAICLNFVYNNPYIDKVIIGIKNKNELSGNIDNVTLYSKVLNTISEDFGMLKIDDEQVVLPFNWKNDD